MAKYWIRIGIGALLVFGLGYTAYATGRNVIRRIRSDSDLTIPLLGIVPFQLNGTKLGSFRSMTIRRNAPGVVTAIDLRARLSDSSAFDQVRDCRLAVPDLSEIDENTTFSCLATDSGYAAFGDLRLELRVGGNTRTMILPVFIPESVAQKLRHHGAGAIPGPGFGDSIAAGIRSKIRSQSRSPVTPKP